MKRLTRASAVLLAAGLAVPVWAAPALAETVAETASVGAYYLSTNPGVVGGGVLPVGGQKAPDNAKSADGVAQDDLAVAVVAANTGKPDKFSALLFDLIDLVPESTVSKATLTIPFSAKPDSRSTEKTPALVEACLAGPEGFGDADGEPFADSPAVMCADGVAQATAVEGGSALEFDITAIAQKWTEMNTGVILYPSKAGFAKPFQMVFADKSQARLTLAFTAPELDDELLFEETPTDDFGATDTTGTTFDSGTTGTFDTTSSLPSSSFDAGSSSFGSGSSSLDAGSALSAPVAAPAVETPAVAAGSQPLRRAASSGSNMSLDGLTWAALLGGAALLAVVSLALGAPAAPAGAARQAVRPGGVASSLARRGSSFGSLGPRLV